ncbi:hypothetical protein [Azospirillum oryzae]|uniref:hypothetical protein n=1 Tax=Azospirillum oryzae TaxID=286727 RepID=UPI00117816C0|nr:hypothetical protein [Azospirillum oryzae]
MDNFVAKIQKHITTCFPDLPAQISLDTCKNIVSYAIDKGRIYGFNSEYEICVYIDIMFILGKNFDTDKNKPWAQRILAQTNIPAGDRLSRLLEMALTFVNQRKLI